MSELIKHECGIGLIRLFKPLSYFQEKYGTPLWGYNKMYMLMEKQRNRGQDGAGLGVVQLGAQMGRPFMTRIRSSEAPDPWTDIYRQLNGKLKTLRDTHSPEQLEDTDVFQAAFPYLGEIMLGHLRYGTHGSYGNEYCHPVSRTNNYRANNLLMAGNFNLTNVDELFQTLIELGQHPRFMTDTETVLERVGYYLDKENRRLAKAYKPLKRKKGWKKRQVAELVNREIDLLRVFRNAAKPWDGGYVMGGALGNGDCFIARDPHSIRPCYYYYNDEFMVAASERAAISLVFDLDPQEVQELQGGHLLHTKAHLGAEGVRVDPFIKNMGDYERKSCSFERIYFSRGSDVKIYQERKRLGKYIVPDVLREVDYDFKNTVFSFIPNTAESAFWGMIEGLEAHMNHQKMRRIQAAHRSGEALTEEQYVNILNDRPRVDKSVSKDVKMRTFIADDSSRDDLVAHVYDITQGIVKPGEKLVCIDDSIVRGTTLRKSILNILARLKPSKIVIVSSAPQIRYPDCYGIDMSDIGKLIAFQAAVELLKETGQQSILFNTYQEIIERAEAGTLETENLVKRIYRPFSAQQISNKITDMLRPDEFAPELSIVYQSLENLHDAIPNHRGDWYFSGDYPTPGGNRIVNLSFKNYYEGRPGRPYGTTGGMGVANLNI